MATQKMFNGDGLKKDNVVNVIWLKWSILKI